MRTTIGPAVRNLAEPLEWGDRSALRGNASIGVSVSRIREADLGKFDKAIWQTLPVDLPFVPDAPP